MSSSTESGGPRAAGGRPFLEEAKQHMFRLGGLAAPDTTADLCLCLEKAAVDGRGGAWLCARKTSFAERGRPDLARGLEFADLSSVTR